MCLRYNLSQAASEFSQTDPAFGYGLKIGVLKQTVI